MKLLSGYEISREKLLEIFESIVAEKYMMECTYAEAFEPTAISLADGDWDDIPVLDGADIRLLSVWLVGPVIECEQKLRATLSEFEASNKDINSW